MSRRVARGSAFRFTRFMTASSMRPLEEGDQHAVPHFVLAWLFGLFAGLARCEEL